MKTNNWLKDSTSKLKDVGITTARLDSLILLEDATKKERGWLLAHSEYEIDRETTEKLAAQLKRRMNHEPLAYIRGKSEFYGREFKVTPATLQPRPETETMVDLLKQIESKEQRAKSKVIVDVGTGSGCIAITIKLEWPGAKVCATELNADALKVAQENAKRLKADVEFYQGNLLEPISALSPQPSALFLMANLPYVPDSHTINQAAMQEPRIAIFGGIDGLDLYREMFKQIQGKAVKPSRVFAESLPFQHEELAGIASEAGYKQMLEEDFIQVFTLTSALSPHP